MKDYTAKEAEDGSVFRTISSLMTNPFEFMLNQYHDLGSVFRLKLGVKNLTVISNQWAEKLLENEEKYFVRTGLFDTFNSETGVDIFSPQGEEHKNVRQAVAVPFSRYLSSQFITDIDEAVGLHLEQSNKERNLFELSSELAMKAAMEILSPFPLQDLTSDILSFSDQAMYVLTKQKPSILLKMPAHRKKRELIFKTLDKIIEDHKDRDLNQDNRLYVIDACLKNELPHELIRSVCIYTLSGANAYLGRMIGFILYETLHNESLKKELLGELSALDADPRDWLKRLSSMPVLRALYFEALRFYPLLPGMIYKAKREIIIDDLYIPNGELVLLTPHMRHFDANFFKDPLTFNYERSMSGRDEHLNSYAYKPYGLGKRMCAAKGMNEVLILTVVISFLKSFVLDSKAYAYRPQLVYNPLLGPKKDIPIRLKKRTIDQGFPIPELVSEAPDLQDPFNPDELDIFDYGRIQNIVEDHVVFNQGDNADAFYVILEGEAEVTRDGNHIVTLAQGDGFGEAGIFNHCQRNATIVARTKMIVIKFEKDLFWQLISNHSEDVESICKRSVALFYKTAFQKHFSALDESFSLSLGKIVNISKGEVIIKEGAVADSFYLLCSGEVEVQKIYKDLNTTIALLKAGDYFGELGILRNQPRNASIVARGQCRAIKFSKDEFEILLREGDGVHKNILLETSKRLLGKVDSI